MFCANLHCKNKDTNIPDGEQYIVWIGTKATFLCKECGIMAEEDNCVRVDDHDYDVSTIGKEI